MTYKFNPEKYGYEPVSNFPELVPFLASDDFVKVTAIGGQEFDRIVYWYSACRPLGHDDRWRFLSSSYDSKGSYESNIFSHQVYMGLISSEQFAEGLLVHLMAACRNKSVLVDGKARLERNINSERLSRPEMAVS